MSAGAAGTAPGTTPGALWRVLTRALALSLLLPALACSDPEVDRASFHVWFEELRARSDQGDGSAAAVHAGSLAALPIVRIELKRSQVYFFTSLEVVFHGGERATRLGGMADWPASSDTPLGAEVPYHEMARLCWLIESLDLPRESESWSVNVSHGEQLDISWTTRDGRTVRLSDYGSAAPPAVGALAAAIENTARRLEWK